MQKAAELASVSLYKGTTKILNEVSLAALKGEVFCILGKVNSGKSACLNLLSGAQSPDKGKVYVLGGDIGVFRSDILCRVGLVFAESYLDRTLSIRRNLEIRAGLYYSDRLRIKQVVEELIEEFMLEKEMNVQYGKATAKARKKTDIARAFINNPELLIMDDATDELDIIESEQLWDYIRGKMRGGLSVVMSTNRSYDIEQTDRICVLDNGRSIYEDSARAAKRNYANDHLILYAEKTEYKSRFLDSLGFEYEFRDGAYDVLLDSDADSVKLLKRHGGEFRRFELRHGTLTEAYLNIVREYELSRGCK